MKNSVVILILSLVFTGCSGNIKLEKPSNFIEKEIFVEVIYDVTLLEGHMASYNLNQDIFKDSARRMYKGIFDKYNMKVVDFKENNEYYVLSGEYLEMSKTVLERLKKEQGIYKDVKPFNTISLTQFTQLFKKDGFVEFFENDTNYTFRQKLDSALVFYRKSNQKLTELDIDSVNFELNIKNLRRSKHLFNNMFSRKEVYKESINKEN